MADVLDAVHSFKDDRIKQKCIKAIDIVDRCLDLYGTAATAFSFNGGKDSTALLHVIRGALEQRRRREEAASEDDPLPACTSAGLGGILTFFFDADTDFSEVRTFVQRTAAEMDLNLLLLHDDMRQGLSRLVESGTRAMLLGTRATDPNARGQDAYAPSSRGWPAFMRVNPLLDWGYHDVWAFLRALRAPYCGLYDQGYSSLGCVASTQRNAALRRPDGSYAPAHQLGNPLLERQGRSRSLPLLPKGRGGPARISPLQASESTASRSTETLAFPSLSLPPSVTVLPPIPGTPTCAARAPCAVLGLLPDALCPSDFLCCCPDDASGSSSPSTAFAAPAARDGELLAAFRQALARVAKGAGAAPGWDLVCLAVQPLSAAWQRDWALQAAAQGCAAVILVTHSAEERDEAAERARGLPHVACLACSDDDLGGAAQAILLDLEGPRVEFLSALEASGL